MFFQSGPKGPGKKRFEMSGDYFAPTGSHERQMWENCPTNHGSQAWQRREEETRKQNEENQQRWQQQQAQAAQAAQAEAARRNQIEEDARQARIDMAQMLIDCGANRSSGAWEREQQHLCDLWRQSGTSWCFFTWKQWRAHGEPLGSCDKWQAKLGELRRKYYFFLFISFIPGLLMVVFSIVGFLSPSWPAHAIFAVCSVLLFIWLYIALKADDEHLHLSGYYIA